MTNPIRMMKHRGHDRFIPYQSKEKADTYAALVAHDQTNKSLTLTPYGRAVSRACFGAPSPTDLKILSAATTTLSPEPRPWAQSPHKDLPAILSKPPLRTLSTPFLYPDFYLNLFSYSAKNSLLAVGLGPQIGLWNTITHSCAYLYIPPTLASITSIAWGPSGEEIFVGKTDGELFCATVPMDGSLPTVVWKQTISSPSDAVPPPRLGVLAQWGDDLFAGNRSGHCYKIDRRTGTIKNSWVLPDTRLTNTVEICQIKISPDGQYIAVGTNLNAIAVYEMAATGRGNPSPIFHQAMNAAVKSIAFDPSGSPRIAFGAGTTDRRIMIASFLNGGQIIRTIDATAQVTSLHWDTPGTLLATLGYSVRPSMLSIPVNELNGKPVLMPITSIPENQGFRVLHCANLSNTSPPQWAVLSTDELIRFFPKTEKPAPRARHPMTPHPRH